ncbi:TPR-like protein [Piromyces finnis]|uniref:Gamma-soluble NSF attachment protein n=1 Tax=Piromyces finnis TaxID=1754191 RepID=A0A1Y1VNU3_9FUNG|nr:TPR-like protein [Piromyces finnis]|eukprot:ORX60050.1 TPR-like protein [Piromyces finnis]
MDLSEAFKKIKEAEKYAHPKSSFFFKKSPEWAEAAHCYETAANMFRAQHSSEHAVEAFMKAAEAHKNSNSMYLAAKCSETAASILEKDNKVEESCRNYELASQEYFMGNSPDRAAAMLFNAAKAIERSSVERAVGFYKRALETVDDGESRLSYDTYKKVIIALIKLRVINEAIDVAMKLNSIYIEKRHDNALFKNELTIIILLLFNDKFSVAEDFFNIFCGEKNDQNGTNYSDFGNKFLNSEEGITADDMLNAYANNDAELMNKSTTKFCVKYLDNEVVKIARELRAKVNSGQAQYPNNNNNDFDLTGGGNVNNNDINLGSGNFDLGGNNSNNFGNGNMNGGYNDDGGFDLC